MRQQNFTVIIFDKNVVTLEIMGYEKEQQSLLKLLEDIPAGESSEEYVEDRAKQKKR